MLAMDQFKDIAGFVRYASRLRVGMGAAIGAWLVAGFDETLGGLIGRKLGPRRRAAGRVRPGAGRALRPHRDGPSPPT